MNRQYVSEFTSFINRFVAEHPEIAEDQRRGRSIYWDRKVDFHALEQASEDSAPDDAYGFAYTSWRRRQTPRRDEH